VGLKIISLGIESSFPEPLTQAVAVVHDHAVYTLGGGSEYGKPRQPCSIAVPVDMVLGSNQWAPLPLLPTPTYLAGIAKDSGKIYVVGGIDNTARPSDRYKRRLQIYDIAERTWRTGNEPPFNLVGPGSAVSYNGMIFVLGGHPGGTQPRCDFWSYDIARDAWTQRPGPPTGLNQNYSCVVVGTKLYAIDRYVGDMDFVLDLSQPNHPWVAIDLRVPNRARGTWYDGIVNFSVTAFGRFIILVGGMCGSRAAATDIWVYDTQMTSWSLSGTLKRSRGMAALAVHSGGGPNAGLYVVGGQVGQSGPLIADVEVFLLIDQDQGGGEDPGELYTSTNEGKGA
jgi:hypothetical protein